MSMDSLKDLYIDELKDLYNAENQLLKALPKMAKKASAPELKRAFQDHLASIGWKRFSMGLAKSRRVRFARP
jgi:ferritin-like metal-binding protein YciE